MRTRTLFNSLRLLGFVAVALLAAALVYAAAISVIYYAGIGV